MKANTAPRTGHSTRRKTLAKPTMLHEDKPHSIGASSESDLVESLTALAQELTVDPYDHPNSYASRARLLASRLPEKVMEQITVFRHAGAKTGVLHFAGLPTGDLPPTPVGNSHNRAGQTLGAKCAAILTGALGELVGYEAEAGGALLQDMAPNPAKAIEQMSVGFSTELELHVEQAHNPLRPDYLSLFCLRGDPTATTYTITAKTLIQHLSAKEVAALREPKWMMGIDPSFKEFTSDFEHGLIRGPWPVLYGSVRDPFILFDQDLQSGLESWAQELLNKLIDIYMEHRTHIILDVGDFLAIDNRRAVHGRSPYFPRFDGTDRWIVRSFATNSLSQSAHARTDNGRVIAARYC